jgi:hypothetical protein
MNLTASDTSTTQHTYTVDWSPDSIKWSIDGKVLRTLNRDDTWNATANRWFYPQTPARIMLSLWPAGIPSNGEGTINWAGGMIDWNSPYMKNGYYYAMVDEVVVECYNPPPGANIKGSKSYIYTDQAATNNTVEETDNIVILKSLQANGDDPDIGAVPSGVSSSVGATNTPASIPGQSGIGAAGDGSNPNPGAGNGNGNGDGSNTQSAGSAATSAPASGFDQGGGSTGKSEGDKIAVRLGGSVFAVLVAVAAALCW